MMVASWDSYSNNEIMTKVVDFEIYKCTIIHNAAVMLGSNALFYTILWHLQERSDTYPRFLD